MAGLVGDSSGQWIVLSGLMVSVSLVIVAVLVNEAAITGYYSSSAPIDFPKGELRELTAQTHETAMSAAQLAWSLNNTTNKSVWDNFTNIMENYSRQVSMIYAAHGDTVNITPISPYNTGDTCTQFNENTSLDIVCMNIIYSDGTTSYSSEAERIEVNP